MTNNRGKTTRMHMHKEMVIAEFEKETLYRIYKVSNFNSHISGQKKNSHISEKKLF